VARDDDDNSNNNNNNNNIIIIIIIIIIIMCSVERSDVKCDRIHHFMWTVSFATSRCLACRISHTRSVINQKARWN
jgi:hypothetical protein